MQFLAGRKLRASELNYDTETGVDCHYRASVNQNLPSGVGSVIAFGTAVRTTPLVTRNVSGVGHTFTVLRGGVWTMTYACRIAAGGTAGNRYASITHSTGGYIMADFGEQVTNTGVYAPLITLTTFLSANDTLSPGFYTDGGSTQVAEFGSDRVSFRLTWLHD